MKLIKKITNYLLFLLLLCFIFFFILCYNIYKDLNIKNIKLLDYNYDNKNISLKIEKENNIFHKKYFCNIYNKDNKLVHRNVCNDDECRISFVMNKDCIIELVDNNIYSKKYSLNNFIENKLNISFIDTDIYLIKDETKHIDYKINTIFELDNKPILKSADENIITVKNDVVTAKNVGKTYLYFDESTEKLNITVTDLIHKPTFSTNLKDKLPCGIYTENESIILDKYLEKRIIDAGKSTRAGVVAAARFLTLEFPYRIPYFYENGRMHWSGTHFIDGEGRYYHKGLYLHNNKIKDIKYSFSGPAIWGCPLTNWVTNSKYGFHFGNKSSNGLDCSGFVAWTLLNGGFDPGDLGSGISDLTEDLTDFGDLTRLNHSIIKSKKIKAGDLASIDGHIAVIIGIDKDNNFYIAESLPHLYGVVAKKYSEKKFLDYFTHVVFMDKYYKNDGNYTSFWE